MNGLVSGLQNQLRRFDSATHLTEKALSLLDSTLIFLKHFCSLFSLLFRFFFFLEILVEFLTKKGRRLYNLSDFREVLLVF